MYFEGLEIKEASWKRWPWSWAWQMGPVLLEGDAETALAGVAPCPGAGHSAVRKRL